MVSSKQETVGETSMTEALMRASTKSLQSALKCVVKIAPDGYAKNGEVMNVEPKGEYVGWEQTVERPDAYALSFVGKDGTDFIFVNVKVGYIYGFSFDDETELPEFTTKVLKHLPKAGSRCQDHWGN